MKKNRVTMLSFLLLFIALAFSTMASLVSAQQSQPVTTHVVPGLRIPLNYIRAGGAAEGGAGGLHCVFSFGSISKPETGILPIEPEVYVPVTEFSKQPYRLRDFQDVLGDLSDAALQNFLCGDPDEILHLSLEHESGEQIEPQISTAEYNEILDAEIVFIGLPDEAFIRQGVWYLHINESVVIFDIAITTPSIYDSGQIGFELVGGFQPYEQVAMLVVCTSEAATLEGFSNRVSRDRNGFVVTDYVFVETLELVEVVEVLEANELGELFFNGIFGGRNNHPSCQPDSFAYYVLVGNQGSVLNGTLFTEDNKLMRDELYELVWASADSGDTGEMTGGAAANTGSSQAICSAGGTQNPMAMTVANYSSEAIDIYWIDSDCNEQYYMTLGVNESYVQETFDGHEWAAYSQSGEYLGAWIANANTPDVQFSADSSGEQAACSSGGTQSPMTMTINNLRDEEIRLLWINYDCGATLYAIIGAHSSYQQDTYDGHEWEVFGSDGNYIVSFTASASAPEINVP